MPPVPQHTTVQLPDTVGVGVQPYLDAIRRVKESTPAAAPVQPRSGAAAQIAGGMNVGDLKLPQQAITPAELLGREPPPRYSGYEGAAGKAFGFADSILRGYMAGRYLKQQQEQRTAATRVSAVNSLWKQASTQWQSAMASDQAKGIDPMTSTDPATVAARNAVNFAWQQRNAAMAEYVFGERQDGKTKKPRKVEPGSPQAAIDLILKHYESIPGAQAAALGASQQLAASGQASAEQVKAQRVKAMETANNLLLAVGGDPSRFTPAQRAQYDAAVRIEQGPLTPKEEQEQAAFARYEQTQKDLESGKPLTDADLFTLGVKNPEQYRLDQQRMQVLADLRDGKIDPSTPVGQAIMRASGVAVPAPRVESVQQQELDAYRALHPGSSILDAENAIAAGRKRAEGGAATRTTARGQQAAAATPDEKTAANDQAIRDALNALVNPKIMPSSFFDGNKPAYQQGPDGIGANFAYLAPDGHYHLRTAPAPITDTGSGKFYFGRLPVGQVPVAQSVFYNTYRQALQKSGLFTPKEIASMVGHLLYNGTSAGQAQVPVSAPKTVPSAHAASARPQGVGSDWWHVRAPNGQTGWVPPQQGAAVVAAGGVRVPE